MDFIDKRGKGCELNTLAITTKIIHDPCPVHSQDCGNLQITKDYSKIRYIKSERVESLILHIRL